MGNNRIKRDSKIFHEELDKIIPPEMSELPNIGCKESDIGIFKTMFVTIEKSFRFYIVIHQQISLIFQPF